MIDKAIAPPEGRIQMWENKRYSDHYHLKYTLNDFYAHYMSMCKKAYGKNYKKYLIPKERFISVAKDLLLEARDSIIQGRKPLKLSSGLGTLMIVKREVPTDESQKKIDWNLTRKHGQKIYHENRHTFGYYFCWKWCRGHGYKRVKNLSMYSFTATRKAERFLCSHIKRCSKDPHLKDYEAPLDEKINRNI